MAGCAISETDFRAQWRARHPHLTLGAFCLIVSTALPLPAIAEQSSPGGPAPSASELYDLNGDGRISYDEFLYSAGAKAMRELDADKDGVITPSEIASGRLPADASVPTIRFGEIDTDGNGQISRQELENALRDNASMKMWFRKFDQNGDGFISGPELDRLSTKTGIRVVPQVVIPFP